MLTILTDFISIFSLLLWGHWLCRRLQLPYTLGPAMGVCWSIVCLTLLGSFSLLWVGAWAFLVLGFGLLILERKNLQSLISYFTAPAVIGFLGACVILEIVYFLKTPSYCQWDELSHWGIYYKCVYYFHNFDVYVPNEIFIHPSYPQGAAALYSLFAILKSSFQERDTYFSLNLILFAAAAALLSAYKEQGLTKIKRLVLTLLSLLLVPLLVGAFTFFDAKAYTTIYLDIPMGCVFAIGLCTLVLDHPSMGKKALALAVVCGANACLKDIGFLYSLCIFGAWFLFCLFKSKNFLQALRYLLFACGLSLLETVVWKIVLSIYDRSQDQFSNMVGFTDKWKLAAEGTDSFFYDVWDAFVARFTTGDLIYGQSTLTLAVICTVLSWGICLFILWRKQSFHMLAIHLLMPIYFLLYCASLFYVYICGMSEAEALGTASYDRYIGSFFVGWFFLLAASLLLLSRSFDTAAARGVQVVVSALLLAGNLYVASVSGLSALTFGTVDWRAAEQSISQALLQQIDTDQNQVLLLSASDPYPRTYYYRYELWPFARVQYTLAVEQDSCDLQQLLQNSDISYLLIFGATPDFKASYAGSFSDGLSSAEQDPETPVLYQVERKDSSGFQCSEIIYANTGK